MNFLRWLGHQHIPFSRKRLKYKAFKSVCQTVKPGDVLLTRTRGEITNLFIPGIYKHAGIYFEHEYVVEATANGVHETHLTDFVFAKDYLAIFRPLFCSSDQAESAADWAWMQRGKEYDYKFKSNNDAYYCFELSYAAYNEILKEYNPWQLRKRLGQFTVFSDDFVKAKSKWGEILCL